MGSLENRLGAVEEALIDSLVLKMMVAAEVQKMLAILEASEDIQAETYEKVVRILADAGYIEEGEAWGV
jgi:hypothetical protein